MNKLNQLARQFLGRRQAPAEPPPAPAPEAAAETAAAPEAPAPEMPPLPWYATSRTQAVRYYPHIVDLPDGQGYLVLRFYRSECRRTLLTPQRLLLPGMPCLASPLFALGEVTPVQDAGAEGNTVQCGFRYVLPPILYTGRIEMETILQQTRQEVTRLLASRMPALPYAPTQELEESLAPMPQEWLEGPPLDGPPPEMEGAWPPEVQGYAPQPGAAARPNVGGASKADARVKKEWIGTIIEFRPRGTIMIKGEEKHTPVLYFHDEALEGGKNSVSGKHLLEAMALSQAGPGDRVRIRHMENVPVDSHNSGHQQGRRDRYMKLFEIDVLEKWQPPAE